MTDLTKITTPFALLDYETREALKAHGGPYELWGAALAKWAASTSPTWNGGCIYRVAPTTKDTINWDHVADEFICMAGDADGRAYVYAGEPNCDEELWTEPNDLDSFAGINIFASYKRGTCDWRDSLVFRPGHEPKGEQTC